MKVCAVIVAAGSATRLNAGKNKALLPLMGQPLFLYAVRALKPFCGQVILVTKEEERAEFEAVLFENSITGIDFANGGAQRRHSVENALNLVSNDMDLVLVHDAARPLISKRVIQEVIQAAGEFGAAIPALAVVDTLRRMADGHSQTVSRDDLFSVQTPQGFQTDLIRRAYQHSDAVTTDDAGLVEKLGHQVHLVKGDPRNIKITLQEDFTLAEQYLTSTIRMGTGFDTHRLVEGRDLILCGVSIPHSMGLLGHSDADVALHALTDALLGACALGDIGKHFPDTKPEHKGVSSLFLLQEAARIMAENGFFPWQCDLTILAQKPKLAPYILMMRENIAQALSLPVSRVSVKATTTEGLGFEGREEGISAQAAAMVREM
ncbi:MAG: 2-C-methyl-D-erythritol 4-phosphate cytidylyltransferase [Bacillota bacterium]|nr:2-C-methyl-D-erythritol 4-phosphate cytidylyltransferase [Bacillota bacterium]